MRRLTDPQPDGLGLSAAQHHRLDRRPGARRCDQLADEGLPVTLAVSLHAPDDELRDTLVPVNTRWKVAEVLDAAWRYSERTGRRVSIEYALIRDINDQAWRADLLGTELNRRGRGWVHVNLIPLNPTPGLEVDAPATRGSSASSSRGCEAHGVPTTVRDTRGREIDGACGQLAVTVTAMSHRRFPRVGRLHKGYHCRQVDAFLDHVEVSLGGVFPPPTAAGGTAGRVRAGPRRLRRARRWTSTSTRSRSGSSSRRAGWRGVAAVPTRAGEAEFLKAELTASVHAAASRAPRFLRRGYHVDDVDEFVDRVVGALDGSRRGLGRGRPAGAVPASPRRLPRGRRRRRDGPGRRVPPARTPGGAPPTRSRKRAPPD